MLHILAALAQRVIVPPAVVDELAAGRVLGVSLPNPDDLNWVVVRRPVSALALPLVTDMGPGETEVLMLALEAREAIVVLDQGCSILSDSCVIQNPVDVHAVLEQLQLNV